MAATEVPTDGNSKSFFSNTGQDGGGLYAGWNSFSQNVLSVVSQPERVVKSSSDGVDFLNLNDWFL